MGIIMGKKLTPSNRKEAKSLQTPNPHSVVSAHDRDTHTHTQHTSNTVTRPLYICRVDTFRFYHAPKTAILMLAPCGLYPITICFVALYTAGLDIFSSDVQKNRFPLAPVFVARCVGNHYIIIIIPLPPICGYECSM